MLSFGSGDTSTYAREQLAARNAEERSNTMSHDKNDELREDRRDQEAKRQQRRDNAFSEGEGAVDDEGSQDERRKGGLGRY